MRKNIEDDYNKKKEIYFQLRIKIQERIVELEEFYEVNLHDSKAIYLEKIRIKLKKVLTYQPESLNLIEKRVDNKS